DLERRVKRIEKQLKAVQRKVFDGASPYFDGGAAPADGAVAGDSGETPLLADLQVRLSSLERQLRELTGRVEEQGFQQRQLAEQMARLREDVEFRLGRLEAGGAATPGTAAAPALQPTPPMQGKAAPPSPSPSLPPSPAPAAEPAAETPKSVFDAAFAALRRGDYDAAEQGFNRFLARYKNDPLASNAQYWLGRTYFVRRDYGRAAGAFLAGYQDYPDGEKAADSLLDLGVTLIELDQKADACAAFDQLRQSFPNASERIMQRLASESARAGCG
ncbi:MAG: tol-pal system protein YbgF, partial [Alphaproteobacteria bacterium]